MLETKSENLLQNMSSKKRKPMMGRLTYENDSDVKRTSRGLGNTLESELNIKIGNLEEEDSELEKTKKKSVESITNLNSKQYSSKKKSVNAEDIIRNIKKEVELGIQKANYEEKMLSMRGSRELNFRSKEYPAPPKYQSSRRKASNLQGSTNKKNFREISLEKTPGGDTHRSNIIDLTASNKENNFTDADNFVMKVSLSTDRSRTNSLAKRCITVKNLEGENKPTAQ